VTAWAAAALAKLAARRLGIELQILNDFLFIHLNIKESKSTLKIQNQTNKHMIL
jgi:hypothetical protein